MGQPIITMGPNGQVQSATMIPAGWPVNPPGLAPVTLLQNHTPGHVNATVVNSKPTLMQMTQSLPCASPIISNVISSATPSQPPSFIPHGSALGNIIPRKSPLTLKPTTTPSRRKRSSLKTAYPRKITLVVPDHVTESPGINVKKFLYPKPVRRLSNSNSDEHRTNADDPNSIVVCDSTAGHDNGRLSSDGTPSPPKGERGPPVTNSHQRLLESSPHSSEPSMSDDHGHYHNQRSDGSSPEHDSSLEENEQHALMIDSDGKESYGNDSDNSNDHRMYHSGDTRTQDHDNRSHYPRDDTGQYPRGPYRSEENEVNDSQYPTAIVRLENTVRVKAEPLDRNSPNGIQTNGVSIIAGERAHSSSDSEHYLPSSSIRGPFGHENDGVMGMPPVHPGTPGISTSNSMNIATNLTPYPPNYPRNGADGVAFRCEQCQKEFDTSAALERHKRSHSGERPYKCKICGWGFNLSGNLNQHMAIHQKVKPFKCVYCGKTFARSNVLKAHVRCHTGERPYQCDLCGAKFIIPHNLKKHLLNRHQVVWEERRWSNQTNKSEVIDNTESLQNRWSNQTNKSEVVENTESLQSLQG